MLLGVCCFLVACEGAQESEELSEAIEVGEERVVSLQVQSQDGKTLFEPNEQWDFSVTATRVDGSSFDASERVNWSTGDNNIASISSVGKLTTKNVAGVRFTNVNTRWAHLVSNLEIRVSDADIVSISVAARDNPVDECRSSRLIATGNFSDGSTRPLNDVNWAASNAAVGRIRGDTFIALASGNAEIVATRAAVSSSALSVVVNDALSAIRFSSGSQLNARLGESLQLQTFGAYPTGEADITLATSWESADPNIIEVSEEGILQANGSGNSSLTAECGGLIESLQVAVIESTDISIVDSEDTDMEAGESRQLELFRVFSDGSLGSDDLADDDKVVWDIDSGAEVAVISRDGEVTLGDDISNFEDSFIRVFAEFEGFEDTLVIRLDN